MIEIIDEKITDIVKREFTIKIKNNIFYYTEWCDEENYVFEWELRDDLKQLIENKDLVTEIQAFLDECDEHDPNTMFFKI